MSFGEIQLKKFGWKEGQGLGREETGISSAIKPKLKFDKSGLGHNKADEFTFHWWDHVYNKTAQNLSVKKSENGEIQISKNEDFKISTKKPSYEVKEKTGYGLFVKGAIQHGSQEIQVHPSERKLTEKPQESLELIKTFSDAELFKLCGGLTAHKGARHGLTMSAKLARLEQQEKGFSELQNDPLRHKKHKKHKKQKRRSREDETVIETCDQREREEVTPLHQEESLSEEQIDAPKHKKHKKHKKQKRSGEDVPVIENCEEVTPLPEEESFSEEQIDALKHKKHKKHKKQKRRSGEDVTAIETCENAAEEVAEKIFEQKPSQKKKKSKDLQETLVNDDDQMTSRVNSQFSKSEEPAEPVRKQKKRKRDEPT